jgi:hypothetical protein
MSQRPERAVILHQGRTLQIARWRDLFIQRWTATSGIVDIRILEGFQREFMAARKTAKFHMLTILEIENVQAPDDEVRQALNENRDLIHDRLASSVVVLDSKGFAASILRGMMSAQRLFRRSPYPSAILGNCVEASTFLATAMRDSAGTAMSASVVHGVITGMIGELRVESPMRFASS